MGCKLFVVGTHIDQIKSKREVQSKVDDILAKFKKREERRLKELETRVKNLEENEDEVKSKLEEQLRKRPSVYIQIHKSFTFLLIYGKYIT